MRTYQHDARFIEDERPCSRAAAHIHVGERASRQHLFDLLDREELLRFWAIAEGSFTLNPNQADRLVLTLEKARHEVMHIK